MTIASPQEITFARLPEISPEEILAHMNDPRVAEHMPLLTGRWDRQICDDFVKAKEDCWRRDGLGHWAILCGGAYAGWGGFQKEGDEWDFGLVLKPESFGLGTRIARKALAFAKSDERIPFVTFLLPPSRKHLRWLERLGAAFVGEVDYAGSTFLKYRLDTE
ncbi:GNAT family N-acetyltransferase [Stappia sediminis]|uniref:GNAT family N-acetyltransferase n=1 Tax=Stappia sediminis TaxID=2692190 RepID=UPI00192871F6|nr:GNAT family N-acetyltransferase [Stappia sediminis]